MLFFAHVLSAQTLTVRNAHSLVYDSKNKQVFLFGGADEKRVYGDTWLLENNTWKVLKLGKHPAPRTFPSLVFDEKHQRIVLFGGNKVLFGSDKNPAEFFGDAWEYKNGFWRKIILKHSPEPRAEAAIAYDKARERIILFGGYNIENGNLNRLSDTWELTGSKWRNLNEGEISARNGAVLAFDSRMQNIVLFGGSTANKDYGENTGESWVLIKDNWRKLNTKKPANVFNSNMVYQENEKRLFRFGGWNGTGRIDETWILDNDKWTKLNLETSPPARNHSSMIYNADTGETILFGGHDGSKIYGDLWIFRNGKWYKQFEHKSIIRLNNGH